MKLMASADCAALNDIDGIEVLDKDERCEHPAITFVEGRVAYIYF